MAQWTAISASDPIRNVGRPHFQTAVNKNHALVCRQAMPNQLMLILYGAQPASLAAASANGEDNSMAKKAKKAKKAKAKK
jgi:hypothetical protein